LLNFRHHFNYGDVSFQFNMSFVIAVLLTFIGTATAVCVNATELAAPGTLIE